MAMWRERGNALCQCSLPKSRLAGTRETSKVDSPDSGASVENPTPYFPKASQSDIFDPIIPLIMDNISHL
jgi:hypothetical protein